MKSHIGHIYIYVSNLEKSYKFYKKLLEYLDYKEIVNESWGMAFLNDGTSIWLEQTPKAHVAEGYHRKRTGLNHLAFHVENKEAVDQFNKEFLIQANIPPMYDTPKSFPEYDESYYAVYFEDPDRIKIEVAYYK